MKVELGVGVNEKGLTLRTGDIVDTGDSSYYLVVKEDRGYICRSLNGETGSTGYHDNLENLATSLLNLSSPIKHYSRDRYKLIIQEI